MDRPNTRSYKYYSGLTSQLPFCGIPIRLDASNKCEFGCAYCFASTRQGFGRQSKLQLTNAKSLYDRLKRVSARKLSSSLDQFLDRRIPVQLGGMSDPFSLSPIKTGTTWQLLTTLNHFNYPTVISTKSSAVSDPEMLAALKDSNFYVRFSTTVVNPNIRSKIDKGSSTFEEICAAAEKLSTQGIPVCFRFQPILPGQECHAKEMVTSASAAGVKHISAEYLKVPIDADIKFRQHLKQLLTPRPIQAYKNLGAVKLGREYILPLEYRGDNLITLRAECKSKGMTFGYADNDLLLLSDGNSCCSAADLYLSDSRTFSANIIGIAKKKRLGDLLKFEDLTHEWKPTLRISTYLNSKARLPLEVISSDSEWDSYLDHIWNGQLGVYTPDFFEGIEATEKLDGEGRKIYKLVKSKFS